MRCQRCIWRSASTGRVDRGPQVRDGALGAHPVVIQSRVVLLSEIRKASPLTYDEPGHLNRAYPSELATVHLYIHPRVKVDTVVRNVRDAER